MEIVLIRHGRPKVNKHVKLDSTSFAFWMAKYDRCNICKSEKPPNQLKKRICDHFIVSSHMPRAITSSQLCLGKRPDLIEKLLMEVPIPSNSIPLILTAYFWIVLNGICWIFGMRNNTDSFEMSRQRSKKAASKLINLANKNEQVAVFGHVVMNYLIAIELFRRGWRISTNGKKFWSSLILQRND